MNRAVSLLFFIFILGFVDYYLFIATRELFKSSSEQSQRTFSFIYWAIPVVSLLLFLGAFILYPAYLPVRVRNLIASAVFIIYISKFLAVIVLFFSEIVRFFQWSGRKISQINSPTTDAPTIPRSTFLTQAALAVGGVQLGAMTWGIISGAHDYRIKRVILRLPNLPKKFQGMTIAQLSDIHTGSFFNKTAVQGGVDLLLSQKPDVVFFTGDLVNNEAKEVKDYFDIFAQVKAPLGVYSTLGNHDYGDYISWNSPRAKAQNLADLKEAHRLMGWNLLLDTHHPLTIENESIGILGIQNWGAGGFAKYGNLEKTLENTQDLPVKLLLSHDPSHWREQVLGKTNIDASFAGHTHGMQFGVEIGDFKWSPVQYRYKEWAGLYQENEQQLYVNRGFGFIGYPGRVGILPEITLFTLSS